MNALQQFLQSASNEAAGTISGPVDLIGMGLRKLGVPVPRNALMSSEWMKQNGLMQDVPQNAASLAGQTFGLLSPVAAAAKAPQIARGLLTMGENAAAPKNVSRGASAGQRGIFMGDLSKTWDKSAAQKALEMEKAGADPRAIWQETGTFKGVDGNWRQEIDDSAAMFNPSTINGKMQENDIFNAVPGMSVGRGSDLLHHPKLSEAYGRDLVPEAYIGNKNTLFGDGVQGAYDPASGAITINAPAKAGAARSTMLHELQHAVQTRQGWSPGGSADMAFRDPRMYGKAAYGSDEARRMLGERMNALAQPTPIDEYARVAWGSSEVTPEIRAAHAEYAKSLRKTITPEIERDVQRSVSQDWYKRLSGEAEARAVQSRMNLTAEQRRALFPFDSYDVPPANQIVR